MVVDERQTIHVIDDEIARVLASHPRRVIERGLHESLRRVLVGHATLRAVGFPLAPRCRRGRIVHAEKQIIVTLDEDSAGQIADALLVWGLADVARQSQDDVLAQVTAQCGAVRIPHFQCATARAPVAAAAIDQGVQDGLQISAERIVQSVLFCPITASRVLGRVEAQGQTSGHATTLPVLIKQCLKNHTRIRRIKGPLALVVAIRKQMAGIIVLRLAQEPAYRLATVGDGASPVIGLAATASDDIASVVRFAIAGAVRHFHGHLKTIGKLSVECLGVAGKHRIFDRDGAVIIVEHRGAEAHRLRQYADSLTEWAVGHESRMKGLAH